MTLILVFAAGIAVGAVGINALSAQPAPLKASTVFNADVEGMAGT